MKINATINGVMILLILAGCASTTHKEYGKIQAVAGDITFIQFADGTGDAYSGKLGKQGETVVVNRVSVKP